MLFQSSLYVSEIVEMYLAVAIVTLTDLKRSVGEQKIQKNSKA